MTRSLLAGLASALALSVVFAVVQTWRVDLTAAFNIMGGGNIWMNTERPGEHPSSSRVRLRSSFCGCIGRGYRQHLDQGHRPSRLLAG